MRKRENASIFTGIGANVDSGFTDWHIPVEA